MPGKDDMVLNLQAIVTANVIGAGLMIMLLISNRTSSRHLFFDEKLFLFHGCHDLSSVYGGDTVFCS